MGCVAKGLSNIYVGDKGERMKRKRIGCRTKEQRLSTSLRTGGVLLESVMAGRGL
jgi:hypothetical protein